MLATSKQLLDTAQGVERNGLALLQHILYAISTNYERKQNAIHIRP
jgi:hypothetical protein